MWGFPKRRFSFSRKEGIGLVMTLLGLGGLRDDLLGWGRILDFVRSAFLMLAGHDVVNLALVVVGLLLLSDRLWFPYLQRASLWGGGRVGLHLELKVMRMLRIEAPSVDPEGKELRDRPFAITCFHVENVSSPLTQGRLAQDVGATLLFYDTSWTPITPQVKGVWQSQRRGGRELPVVYLSAVPVDIGRDTARELAVLIHYEGGKSPYGLGEESCGYEGWKNPEMNLGERAQFYVRVILQGENIRQESYWMLNWDGIGWWADNVSPPAPLLL